MNSTSDIILGSGGTGEFFSPLLLWSLQGDGSFLRSPSMAWYRRAVLLFIPWIAYLGWWSMPQGLLWTPNKISTCLSGAASWNMDYILLSPTEMGCTPLQHSQGGPMLASYWSDAFYIKGCLRLTGTYKQLPWMGQQGKGEAIDFEIRPNHWSQILDVSLLLTSYFNLLEPNFSHL